jgi:hypothetical protein
MGGANNMPTGGGNNGFFGGNSPSSGNVGGGKGTSQNTGNGGWGGKGTNQSTGYNPQSTMSYNAPTQQMLYAPSTPIPQNVQAKYAPQQNYRNTPMSVPPPAPTANGVGFNLGDINSILRNLFGGGQPGQGFPTQPTTNQAPQTQGNAGYIQQPVLPSMVGPEAINNAPAAAPTINRAPIVQAPPAPAPTPTPAPEPAPNPLQAVRFDDEGYYNSQGQQLKRNEDGELYVVVKNSEKRGGRIKSADEVDHALRLVRGVVKKDKK